MYTLKVICIILICSSLTLLTQIGGIVYLLSLFTHRYTNKWANKIVLRQAYRFVLFMVLYCLATFLIVPVIAKPFGRVPLPLTETNHLQPLNFLTCFLNRNYVAPRLKQTVFEVSQQISEDFPGTNINYLDADFPFLNGFPLIPHLSHNDGKKLDLSFCYLDSKTKAITNKCPSFIGYGVSEEPLPGEKNTAEFCSSQGFWQYSFLMKIISQKNKQQFIFDSNRTKALVNLFVANTNIEKIFIEPHLKTRLKLTSGKIRFHGCAAVRHDDHIHIQLK